MSLNVIVYQGKFYKIVPATPLHTFFSVKIDIPVKGWVIFEGVYGDLDKFDLGCFDSSQGLELITDQDEITGILKYMTENNNKV